MIVRIIGGHGGVSPGCRATSYLIDGKLLIDAGSVASGIQIDEQILIDDILISHSHLDHISDLAFMADNCFGLKGKSFEIHTNLEVKNSIMTHLLNDEIWPDFTKIPNEKNPTLKFNEIEIDKILQIGKYKVKAVKVNHFAGSLGFIIEINDRSVIFTQDTGPTDKIWELAKNIKNLKAIFTEVSFPNKMQNIADLSRHHTAQSMAKEIEKMPKEIPIFLGHIKPNYKSIIFQEISDLGIDRFTILGSDETTFVF